MRPTHPLLTVVAAAGAALVAACGGGASSNTLGGLSPRQATLQSVQKLSATSLKYDLDAKVSVDTTKLQNAPSDVVHQITENLGGNGLTIAGTGQQETDKRLQVDMTVKPLVSQAVTAVVYDGTFYYSLDGGRTFGSGGSLASLTSGFALTPDQYQGFLGGLPESAFSDRGQTQMDGLTVEHYSAQVTKDQLFQSIAGQNGSGAQAQQNLQLIEQFVTLGTSTVDAYVRTDTGQLDRYSADFQIGFDLGKLAQAFSGLSSGSSASSSLPGGTLGIGVTASVHLHDYGASIHIAKPTVDPNAPRLPSGLGGLLG